MKAFPMAHPSENTRFIDAGMDLRDYFAAKALQGILACNYTVEEEPAILAYQYADEMMKVREK